MRRVLGRGRVEGAEGDIIGPRLPRFHRQMTAVMASDADLDLGAQQLARRLRIAIALPQMHAVRAEPLRQRDAVIDDESDVAVGAQPLQRFRRARDCIFVHALQPQLERRHAAAVERGGELVDERRFDGGRGNEVELARGAKARFELGGELWVERQFFVCEIGHGRLIAAPPRAPRAAMAPPARRWYSRRRS